MLFSPRNELDKNVIYALIGFTCLMHVVLLGLFFLLDGYLFKPKPIIFDLKNMGSRVSMLSRPSQGAQAPPVQSQVAQQKPPVKTVPPKPTPAKKPVPKVAPKKPEVKKNTTIPVKKIVAPKKPVPQEAKKPAAKPVQAQKPAEAPKKPAEPVVKEFTMAEATGTLDEFTKEIMRHLTVPPGIDDFEPFPLTFDLDDTGRVVNLKPRGKEPLVIYTAFKDALLKSSLPIKNRTNVTLIIK